MLEDQDLIALQEARRKVEAAYAAWLQYRGFSQEQIDAVVEAAAEAGRNNALRLAEMAVEETRMGNVRDKLAKNLLNADLLPKKMRGMKTVGVLRELPDEKVVEIGVPMGVVAAIVPTTNPTSTVIFKTLVSLKSGNAVVISPHPRAKKCTCYTADLLREAAEKAGAPAGLIQCLENITQQSTQELMRHRRTAIILATGGQGLVRAAYSSGKPALGVGPGNVPILVEKTADVAEAVAKIVQGKSFDYGTVCSSEQVLVTCRALRDQVLEELRKNKAYLATETQAEALGRLLITPKGTVRPECVGQSPVRIAQMAGFEVPPDTSIIAAEIKGIGPDHPLSREKLSPVLALYFAEDFEGAMRACEEVLELNGLGHTCVIFSRDDARIREFGLRMPAFRVLVNTPSPHGSVGVTTNVFPSMTLGCGAVAGNSTSDNVGPQHLINIKRIAYAVRSAEEALPVPEIESAETAAPSAAPPVPAPAAAAPTAAGRGLTQEAVEAIVEKYLRRRGVVEKPSGPQPARDAADTAAEVVDRFLAGRRRAVRSAAASCQCPLLSSSAGSSGTASDSPAASPPSPASSAEPPVRIVDFVCENDVREAMENNRKIFIGPRTIVTPAARELAARGDILVLAERK